MQKPKSAKVYSEKITILFDNHQTALLDEIAAAIRRETGGAISRSALVRAMVMAAAESATVLLDCGSEREVFERLRQLLKRARC